MYPSRKNIILFLSEDRGTLVVAATDLTPLSLCYRRASILTILTDSTILTLVVAS